MSSSPREVEKQTAYLSIEDDSAPLIDPEVLFYETSVLGGEETVCEADEAVVL